MSDDINKFSVSGYAVDLLRSPPGPRAIVIASAVLLLFAYYLTFSRFFPNERGLLGHDYGMFLPLLLDGYFWYVENGILAVDWFTPSFCGGVPRLANPQGIYYSVPQFLTFAVDPLTSIKLTLLIFASLGFAGMYLLLRRSFGFTRPTAFLGATLFLYNGFFAHRMLIGHLTYHSFMLVPFIAHLLLTPNEVSRSHLGKVFDIVSGGLLIAYMFLSGMVNAVVPALLAVMLICMLHLLHFGDARRAGRIILGLAASVVLAVCLTATSLTAALAFLNKFPRDLYPLPGFSGVVDIFRIVLSSLFWQPAHEFGNAILLNTLWRIDRHEYEYGITVVPLLILLASVSMQRRHTLKVAARRALQPQTLVILTLILLLLALPMALNFYSPSWNEFLKQVPLTRSSSTMLRWLCLYIPFVIVLSAIALESKTLHHYSKRVSIAGVVFVILANLHVDRSFYDTQGYKWDEVVAAHARAGITGKPPVIADIGVMVDVEGKAIAPLHRNNLLADGKSQILCYESIFGYRLENFPIKTLQTGPALSERDGLLNVKNPACYVYPSENNCKPGDHFTAAQRNSATAFISYRPFPFQTSQTQQIAGIISIVTLSASLLFLICYWVIAIADALRVVSRKGKSLTGDRN